MEMKLLQPDLYEVESTSRPGQTYIVDAKERSCTCLGFRFRGSCRHLKAVLENSSQNQSYHCNLCGRIGLHENEVIWRGDDGWVCLNCDEKGSGFKPSEI